MGKLKMRSVPALSAAMPMWDCLHLFKIGRAHMAVLCEATERPLPCSLRCDVLSCSRLCVFATENGSPALWAPLDVFPILTFQLQTCTDPINAVLPY